MRPDPLSRESNHLLDSRLQAAAAHPDRLSRDSKAWRIHLCHLPLSFRAIV
jgi:hypothetical protein